MALGFACPSGVERAIADALALKFATLVMPNRSETELAAEVRALLVRCYAYKAQVADEPAYFQDQMAEGFSVWEHWLADPAHPDIEALHWLAKWLAQTGEYHVRTKGTDPFAADRAIGLALIPRIIAAAGARQMGESIRERRLALKLSQRAFADLVDVTETTAWRWEHGNHPSAKHQEKIDRVLGKPAGEPRTNITTVNFDRLMQPDIVVDLKWRRES